MTPLASVLLAAASAALLFGRRQWSAAVFVWACCILGYGEGLELGGSSFWLLRLVVLVGLIKVALIGPRMPGGLCPVDYLVLLFGVWMLCSSMFHADPWADLITKAGNLWEIWGVYFVFRRLSSEMPSFTHFVWLHAIVFVPVALFMAIECVTLYNYFGHLGLGHWVPQIRDGRPRAYGPFQHPILAGTIGGASFPLFVGLIVRSRRVIGWIGACAALTMVMASASSGPIVAWTGGVAAVCFWPLRRHMRLVRWVIVAAYVVLDMVMVAPAYYLMARIDLTGSSSGWHRAALIEAAINHFNEWWFAGTDYTRHWMPTGVTWSPNHTDITNHYLHYGVVGGVLLVVLFVLILAYGFKYLGVLIKRASSDGFRREFTLWCVGSCLFAHAFAFLSVRYYDQSLAFVFSLLALAATTYQRERIKHHKHFCPKPLLSKTGQTCSIAC